MEKNQLIVKHNSLIRSRYDYTLAELRLIITVASMVKATDKDFGEYVVSAQEYAELMGADKQNTYKMLQELGESLLKKPLKIPKTNGFAICNWFSWYEYKEKEGHICCSFHPNLKPYMLELAEQFTKYKLENILKMKSTYSIRLYEIAKSWEARGYFPITIEDLKELIGCSGSYEKYNDFKRFAVERAIKEINELTDLEVSFKEIKTNRKVTSLQFEIKKQSEKTEIWLKNERTFISYMRKNYVNFDILKIEDKYTDKKMTLSIAPNGTLYDKNGANFTAQRSKELWSSLYAMAKEKKLFFL